MKRLFPVFFLLIIGMKGNAQKKGNIPQTLLYVSLSGDDRSAGTLSNPLRTLPGALQKLPSLPGKDVVILLRAGTYYLDTTVVITETLVGSHRLSIHPFKNERVILSGSRKITPGWKQWKNGILQASIGSGLSLDQLTCNGRLLHRARYPNYDSTQRVFDGTAADAISKERVKKWSHPEGGYVHALHQGEWGDFHYRITGADSSGELRLEGGWQNNRPAPMHPSYRFVENILEELDTAAEWYYDPAAGTLYVYPSKGTDPATALWEYSALDQLIAFKGHARRPVRQVTLRGIGLRGTNRTFMQTREPLLRTDWTIYRGGAILIEGGEDITIAGCDFEGLGGNAIFVSNYNRNVAITGNRIDHIGASAIAFVGSPKAVRSPLFKYEASNPPEQIDRQPGPLSDDYPSHCSAYDNLIHDIGKIEKQVAGVTIDMASRILVSHNTIYTVPRSGINIGDGCWGGDTIEYNDVFNTVLETGDHGAFNSWGRDRFWLPDTDKVDSLVEKYPDLPLLDVLEPNVLRNNRFYCAHGWDIDLDDGSSNYRIYNNICLNGGLKLREGYYRVVENNVLVNNTFHPHVWYEKSGDVFRHNIVMADYAPVRIKTWGIQVDSNFFLQRSSLEAARKNGTDANSLYGNPDFVNPEAGDYRVKAGSAAQKIGFKNFAMNEFGVVSPRLKALAAKPPITGIQYLQVNKQGAVTVWMGASLKNIETLGEQSASGSPDKDGVLILKVAAGSLADKSGLQPGDIIRRIDGKPIANTGAMFSSLQAVNWMGQAKATVLHHQQEKEIILFLK